MYDALPPGFVRRFVRDFSVVTRAAGARANPSEATDGSSTNYG